MNEAMERWPMVGGLVAMLALVPGVTRASDYVLGPDDVIAISVWMHPELERVVSISSTGMIVFPPVGEVAAAGLTSKQLADRLGDRISAYLRQTATVTVTVRDYLSHSVYVTGGVAKPGRYGFETIPNLVDVINQAGGALTGSDLSRVQVVRQDGSQRRTLVVDVASVQANGSVETLPKLKPGDVVMVPAGVPGAGGPVGDGVVVLGAVERPGIYPAAGGQDIWTLIASAGGLTPLGDLRQVHVVTRGHDSKANFQVDLDAVLRGSARSDYVVQAGDVVFVGQKHQGVGALSQILQISLAALNVALLIIVIQHGGHY
jgi:polysaccharide export outer membrane protein